MPETPYATLGDLVFGDVDPVSGAEFTLQSLSGWDAVGSTVAVQQRPRGHGGWAGDGFRAPRHPALSGLINAPSEAAMWAARDRLNAAVTVADTTLTVHGADRSRWATVRRDGEVLIRDLTPQVAQYSIQLLAADPRKFGQTLTVSTGLPSSTGGLTFPHTFPHTFAATTVSGQVSLTNPGNVAGPVRLRIDGPVTGPVVTHVSSGRALVFASSLVLGAGQWVEVDMEARTVLENGQASRNGWVTSRGWSQFEPGENVYAFTATAYDAGSLLTVTAVESWE